MVNNQNSRLFRLSAAFFIISCIVIIVYLANDIIAPLIISLLFAILLQPMVTFLNEKVKLPNVLAVVITVVFSFSLIATLFSVLGYLFSGFLDDLPSIQLQLTKHYHSIQEWIRNTTGYSYFQQNEYFDSSVTGTNFLSLSYLSSLSTFIFYIVFIPIYTFLILVYRSLLVVFIFKLTINKDKSTIHKILTDIKLVMRSYIVGLMIQMLFVSILIGIGYYVLGLKYFIFLGVMTGILNIIPYIGIIVSAFISSFILLTYSDDMSLVLWVLSMNLIVHIIDGNFIIPKIVGSKVSINALASMLGIVIGSAIAGIPGMFLALPILAMLKVIFQSTKGLEPYAYLIGDDVPKQFNWRVSLKRKGAPKQPLSQLDEDVTTENDQEDNN